MKIATFNCNSVRIRLPAILAWIAKHNPDILALQETKVADEHFPADAFRRAGFHLLYRGMKGYNGIALLSRQAPDAFAFGFPRAPREEARLVYAQFGSLHLINTYVPQGRSIDHPMYGYKLKWLRRLRRWFDAHFSPRNRVLWLGDLNVAAEPRDVHNPEAREQHVCYHAAARRAFADCRAWGFTDVYRQFHPEAGRYTFFDYRRPFDPNRNRGWRLDYLLASPPLSERARRCEIDVEPRSGARASDHVPVYAEFDL